MTHAEQFREDHFRFPRAVRDWALDWDKPAEEPKPRGPYSIRLKRGRAFVYSSQSFPNATAACLAILRMPESGWEWFIS